MNDTEYFLVEHALSVNLEKVSEQQLPLDESMFEAEIPGPFKMASDLSAADISILAPLKLQNDTSQALWSFLQAQNQKINTLLSYVLSQQDDEKIRYTSTHFSAGSLIISQTDEWVINDNAIVKIFLPEESAAIYCYGQVCDVTEQQTRFNYTFIREQDRELLIRASLHIQSQQLKARVKQRENNNQSS